MTGVGVLCPSPGSTTASDRFRRDQTFKHPLQNVASWSTPAEDARPTFGHSRAIRSARKLTLVHTALASRFSVDEVPRYMRPSGFLPAYVMLSDHLGSAGAD
jgi:hypothetical protein